MVMAIQDGNRRIIAAVDDAARVRRLAPGMTIAHAQSLIPDLHVLDATPDDDEAALRRLGLWCTRYSPLVTVDPPDGIFIDIAGSAHLFKGEATLLDDLRARLVARQVGISVAIADTPGTAWAVTRYGEGGIVAPGRMGDVIGTLPVAALRIPAHTVEGLHDVGIERIAQLASKPRATLQTRFGKELLLRLDQALGTAQEALSSIEAPEVPRAVVKFAEPIANPDDLRRVITKLCDMLIVDLERRGIGARRLDLVFTRVDNVTQAVRIGTGRPSRDGRHLAKLLAERIVLVDPGFGIEQASLTASWVEALTERQTEGAHVAEQGTEAGLDGLVDTLSVRLGSRRVFRIVPVESEIPERSLKRVAPLSPASGVSWPDDLPRPARLLDPPQLVQAVAEIPDAPPLFFVWKKIRHRVVKADGPERIHGEWWLSDKEVGQHRDYYRVENASGERFWLFRDAPAADGGRWWLHGVGEA